VADHPLLRGIVHAVTENGGVATLPVPPVLPPAEALLLRRQAIRLHGTLAFCSPLLKPHAMALRSLLLRIHTGQSITQPLPGGAVSVHLSAPLAPSAQALLASLGWLLSHNTLVRLDIAASLMQDMQVLCARTPKPLPLSLASRLLKGLGIRLQPPAPLPPRYAGPPAPFMVLPARHAEKRKQHSSRPKHGAHLQTAQNNSPFAILRTLRSQM
jgi:ATP-dependent RNA helicase SUPV3L1/SUV3